MKKMMALLLALLCLLPLNACAAEASVQVSRAEDGRLELELDNVPEGTLVTAAYQGGRMVACAVTRLLRGAVTAVADFLERLPEDAVYKAFVLDGQTTSPLMPPAELTMPGGEEEKGKALVAYFSCTNNTKAVAEKLAQAAGADLYEIVPEVPYTSADLNYNSDCRANREQNDPDARPAITGGVERWDSYDVVFLGYPIWWGKAPKIIHTFLESYDWVGKTIVPFCTSGSSPYNDSSIKPLAGSDATWVTGCRFANSVSQSDVSAWVDGLGLDLKKEEAVVTKLEVSFNGHSYTAALADNPSVDAFVAYLRQQGGAVTIAAHDYGGFEKVGPLGTTIVETNTSLTTVPGDLILYQGSSVCLYYAANSWNFTPLGRLEGDLSQLKEHLGGGDASITYALAQ